MLNCLMAHSLQQTSVPGNIHAAHAPLAWLSRNLEQLHDKTACIPPWLLS